MLTDSYADDRLCPRLKGQEDQNGFYEGTPHGSVELAHSELIFYSCYFYIHLDGLRSEITYIHILCG